MVSSGSVMVRVRLVVRVRVRFKVCLLQVYFLRLYSADGASVPPH